MIKRKTLVEFLDCELDLPGFSHDHSNNGLQLEGNAEVETVVFGVDGCLDLFCRAAELKAQMVIVHHGISWGAEPRRMVGVTAGRLRTLFQNNISLYAAHLPLDAHPVFGNNAVLSQMAELRNLRDFCEYDGRKIGFSGEFDTPRTIESIAEKLESKLHCKAVVFSPRNGLIKSAGVVSGGGGSDALESTAEVGAELLITGEWTHQMYPLAKELGISVIALGHYASETTGVNALKRRLESEFGINGIFVDLPTGL